MTLPCRARRRLLPRFAAVAAVVCLSLLALSPRPATANPQDVVNAWDAGDTALASQSNYIDLLEAISLIQQTKPADLPQFQDAVKARVNSILWGISPAPIDEDPQGITRVDFPTWLAVTAIAAGLVLAGGCGAALWRRLRRRPAAVP
jgi:hypothetical protein